MQVLLQLEIKVHKHCAGTGNDISLGTDAGTDTVSGKYTYAGAGTFTSTVTCKYIGLASCTARGTIYIYIPGWLCSLTGWLCSLTAGDH